MGSLRERNPSVWIATTEDRRFGSLMGDLVVDVAVVGAGITGLTAARLLVEEGRSVAVIEAGPVCAGATGYTTAKVTSLHSLIYAHIEGSFDERTAADYAAANEAGVAKIVDLVARDGVECELEGADAFTYAVDVADVAAIEAEVAAAQRAGLRATLDTAIGLPFAVAGAVRVEGQYQFHPRKYCLGLADAIRARGGAIYEHTRAIGLDAGTKTISTDHGTVSAKDVILATHQPFPKQGAYFARGEPRRSYAIAVRIDGQTPAGMYISAGEPTRSLRSTADGRLIIGGEGHKVGVAPDPPAPYGQLEAWAREHFDVRSVDHRWSAQDYVTPDRIPYVGRMTPRSAHVFVATGFGKWGMTNGTAAAMILTDLICERESPWFRTFDSNRRSLAQSAKRLITDNVDVAKHFVGDRIASLKPRSAGDLPAGEGGIVELDGQTVAAYRDDDGTLHAVSATCTHLGCRVAFNSTERTWDCPCHGSRFDTEGRMLEGPAVQDLALLRDTVGNHDGVR